MGIFYLHLVCELEEIDLVEDLVWQHSGGSFERHESSEEFFLLPESWQPMLHNLDLKKFSVVSAAFEKEEKIEELLAELDHQSIHLQHSYSESLQNQDWLNSWTQHYKPHIIGNLLLHIPQQDVSSFPAHLQRLCINPAQAFGTGEHETTKMCLDWLAQQDLKNYKILDYGTGSGILAIAAAMLGAQEVDGIDIDPKSIEAAHNNTKLNKPNQLGTCIPQFFLQKEDLACGYSLIIANIFSSTLMQLKNQFEALSSPHARIILTGVLAEQADELIDFYKDCFALRLANQDKQWVLLEGVKL